MICVAWTGIAATILLGGRTVHSVFKLPLDLNEVSNSSISLNSKAAKFLSEASVIIWDEAPMAPLHALDAIDRILKKIMRSEKPFGGKTLLLGGDFRQVTPVIKHASRTKIVENSIKYSKYWPQFRKLFLTKNMRALGEERDFGPWRGFD